MRELEAETAREGERERGGLRKKMKESMREGWREKIKIVQL